MVKPAVTSALFGTAPMSAAEQRQEALCHRVVLGTLGGLLHLPLRPTDLAGLAAPVLDLYARSLSDLRARGRTPQTQQTRAELLRYVRDLRLALARGAFPLRLIPSSDALAWTHATVVTGAHQIAAQHLRELGDHSPWTTSRSEYLTAARCVERLDSAAAELAGPALRPSKSSSIPLPEVLSLLNTVRLMRAQLLTRTLHEGQGLHVGDVRLSRTRLSQNSQGAYVLSGTSPLRTMSAVNEQGAQLGMLDALTAQEQHWAARPIPLLRLHRILWDTLQENGSTPLPAELGLPSVALVAATSGEDAADALSELYGYAVIKYRISTLDPGHA